MKAPPRVRALRSPLRRFSLRVRLVAAFGLGALALSVVLAAVTFEVTKGYLLDRREHTSQQQALSHADAIDEGLRTRGTPVADILAGLRTTSDTQSLLHIAGHWYTSAVGVGPSDIPAQLERAVSAGTSQHQRIRLSGAPVLVIGVALKDHTAQYYELSPLRELDSTLRTLSSVLVIVAASVTVAAAALGFWTSRRLLRPLTEVAETSREIAAGKLDARIGETPDRQLAMLSTAFNDMADALAQRIQREVRFTADVSHELRSPLTVVSAALGVLEARRGELSERGASALDLLSDEIRRFSQLVEDLLEISRMDAGVAVDLEPVSLAQIVLRAQMLTSLRMPVNIQVDSPALGATMLGDKRRLERIVANLLDNADRFAMSQVALHLAVVGSPPHRMLELSVDDDGPGVAESDRERIFERFARSSAPARRGEGSGAGLGLALVQQHVQLHGGRLRLERSTLGGARFVIQFPEMAGGPSADAEAAQAETAEAQPDPAKAQSDA